MAWKTGLSDSLTRIHSEIASRPIDSRNGRRQPQSAQASALISDLQPSTTIRLSTNPPTTLAWM
jgi:hypothetical protein